MFIIKCKIAGEDAVSRYVDKLNGFCFNVLNAKQFSSEYDAYQFIYDYVFTWRGVDETHIFEVFNVISN